MRVADVAWPFFAVLASVTAFTACTTGSGGPPSPAATATCGAAPVFPNPTLQLAYPVPGTTAVPDAPGNIVVQGLLGGPYGNATVSLAPSPGPTVPGVGTPTLAPSPLPSPLATSLGAGFAYYDVPVPALSPGTTYTASFSFVAFDSGNPPTCTQGETQVLGSFTTQ